LTYLTIFRTLSDAEFLKTVLARAGTPSVNKPNKLGETALHCAVLHGNVPLCKFLLENGGQISAQNE
jgi:ankyrin repeat protein